MGQAGKSYDEEIEEWFDRLDFDLDYTVDEAHIGTFMTDRAVKDGFGAPTQGQVATMWGAAQTRYKWAEAGMKPFTQRTTIGSPLRFGIKGMRGSFGIERARDIYQTLLLEKPPF